MAAAFEKCVKEMIEVNNKFHVKVSLNFSRRDIEFLHLSSAKPMCTEIVYSIRCWRILPETPFEIYIATISVELQ